MKQKNLLIITMIISSLFFITTFSIEAADVTISDGMGDVGSIDFLTGETNVVSSHPDINVDNLDLVKVTYTQQGTQATVSLQVKGNIEDRGKLLDWYNEDILNSLDTVYYEFQIFTSEQDYLVTYSNETGMQQYNDVQINLTSSNFSVVGSTLTISFTLTSAAETYSNLSVTSYFIKGNFLEAANSEDINIVLLSDIAPNPPLAVLDAYASNIGSIGESIQFNASVEPLTGQPPYTYHWDFGDQSSSTQLNPTHTYTKAGNFTYTFKVTDNAGATEYLSDNIIISGESGDGGTNDDQMILFLAILLIIIVVGVVIVVWIIRRR
jgi:PKD repeat protein